jgi:hypothetical protein
MNLSMVVIAHSEACVRGFELRAAALFHDVVGFPPHLLTVVKVARHATSSVCFTYLL